MTISNPTLAAVPLLLLAACGGGAEQQEAANAANQASNKAAAAPAAPATAVPSLEGQWRVTAIDGRPLEQIFPMTAAFQGGKLTISSDCVRLIWSYTQDRNMVGFTSPSAVECAKGRTTNEVQVEKLVGRATMVLFAKEGAEAQLSGSGGNLTLERA